MLKIKNVPIGCGSIGIDEQKTLKNYILSFKIQPAHSGYIIQRKFLKIQRKIKGISFFAFSPVELVFYYSNGGLLNSLDTDASFDTHIDTFLN